MEDSDPSTLAQVPAKIPLPSMAAHTQPLRMGNPTAVQIPTQLAAPTHQTVESPRTGMDAAVPETPRDARHQRLVRSIELLQTQITEKEDQLAQNLNAIRQHQPDLAEDDQQSVAQRASEVVSRHIRLLHQYNEIKDIGLGLMGLIADQQGKRLGEIMNERNMEQKD